MSYADYSYDPRYYYAPQYPRYYDTPPSSAPSSSSSSTRDPTMSSGAWGRRPYYSSHKSRRSWPPSPSVEDDASSPVEGEPPKHTRGTVDQESLLDDIEQPVLPSPVDDRRFVFVPEARQQDTSGNGRPKPTEERPDMPPVFTERKSTPYAFTPSHPRSRSPVNAPSPGAFLRSPEPMTPAMSMPPSRSNTFATDDSDLEPEDTTHLRTERRPARYSFVKSDLHREDLRANLRGSLPQPESRKRDSWNQPPALHRGESSGSSKDPYNTSPRSSNSSFSNATTPKPKSSRPASPLQRPPSPKLPLRPRESPPSSRPSSRANNVAFPSPLSSSTTFSPTSPRIQINQADRHFTFPLDPSEDRSRPPSKYGGNLETMPIPTPRIGVQSPSPSRQPPTSNPLPYPVDDRPVDVFMPPEEHYQFDHSAVNSPKQAFPAFPESPRPAPLPASPRASDNAIPPPTHTSSLPIDASSTRRPRSYSSRSQTSLDARQGQLAKKPVDLDRPLPSCPRSVPSARYVDWYGLQGSRNFDICPKCYDGVFADTPFARYFSKSRPSERPIERFCDFSSPWMRLAWLLTIKQRRSSLELVYALADVADGERPCPGDREIGADRVTWYGIPDQRDGVHVANFTICACDKKMIEALFPTLRGYFTKLPPGFQSYSQGKFLCSLRTSSRRFPTYVDLLVELDGEANIYDDRPDISRFVQLARDNAFKGECGRDRTTFRKPWHFIPQLPEFTVCEECYDELVWPALSSSKPKSSAIPSLFGKAIQLVPGEDPDVGSSCSLYSPRMRRVFDESVKYDDFAYLRHRALERKKMEVKLAKARKGIVSWMVGAERGSKQWDRARSELKNLEREWAEWE